LVLNAAVKIILGMKNNCYVNAKVYFEIVCVCICVLILHIRLYPPFQLTPAKELCNVTQKFFGVFCGVNLAATIKLSNTADEPQRLYIHSLY